MWNKELLKSFAPVLLFSLYSPVALLSFNINETALINSYRIIIIIPILGGILFLGIWGLLKNVFKASLLSIVIIVLFSSYGHIYNLFRSMGPFGEVIGRHRYLMGLWLFFFLLFGYLIVKRNISSHWIMFLNIVAITALIQPIYQIIAYQINQDNSQTSQISLETSLDTNNIDADQILPDIYYIILDAYMRDDYLGIKFDFDNSSFLNYLTNRGFFVASCSQSNYAHTLLSLASSLNMNFIETFYDNEIEGEIIRSPSIHKYIQNSLVRQTLEGIGYKTIGFETNFIATELSDADLYISSSNFEIDQNIFTDGVNDFEVLYIRSTPLIIIIPALSPKLGDILFNFINLPNLERREIILFTLDVLPELSKLNGPNFIFAHIMSPHAPMIFGPNGEMLPNYVDYLIGYPNQITYLNSRLETIIDQILENSNTPPIIIIQGDHGAKQYIDKNGRMAILNAYYLPDGVDKYLYSTITPINTFRLILSKYFNLDYELLEDNSFHSNKDSPQDYTQIINTRVGCENP